MAAAAVQSEREVTRVSLFADAWKMALQHSLRSDVEALAINTRGVTSIAGSFEWRTETTYFGYSGGSRGAAGWRALPSELSDDAFQGLLRAGPSKELWSIRNCAAFKSFNLATLDSANPSDLFIWEIRRKTLEPFQSCANCELSIIGPTNLSNNPWTLSLR